ncbi:MAG: hypothetical protein ACYSWX_01065 [Planctomycetota bacterium]
MQSGTRRRCTTLLAGFVALGTVGCAAPTVPILARAQIAPDFQTYDIRRVALLPPMGPRDTDTPRPAALNELQDDLLGFLSSGTPFEFVELSRADLGEIQRDDPIRDGRLSIDSLLGIAERFRVEAVFYSQVTREQLYPPLSVGLQAEMVSVDTGQVLWTADVQLSGDDAPVRDAIRDFYEREQGEREGGDGWKVALVSPRRFTRFAAWQLAQLL